jgi:hypothetical protein
MLINDEIQRQVLPVLARASAVSTTLESQQRAGAQLQLNPGQQVKAEIISNLPNNLYLARIAGEMFKLEIPLNVQPGETMEMTFVSADPRITFQFLRPEGGGELVSFSSFGKWLSSVARDFPSLPLQAGTLLESAEEGATVLGDRLKAALTQSGLFYEAHLAQWASGGLQLAELLEEPQGKLSRAARRDGPPQGISGPEEAEFADVRTLPQVRQQLLLLNSGVLSWKGEAWPGQGMELAVTARDADEGEREVEAILCLDLAHLGGVEAKLRFGAEGLFLDFVCGRKGSAALLREVGGELRSALASSGLQLTRMVVKDDEAAE